jgi:hypothetical protein
MCAQIKKQGLNRKISIFFFLPLLHPLNHGRGRGDEGVARGARGARGPTEPPPLAAGRGEIEGGGAPPAGERGKGEEGPARMGSEKP